MFPDQGFNNCVTFFHKSNLLFHELFLLQADDIRREQKTMSGLPLQMNPIRGRPKNRTRKMTILRVLLRMRIRTMTTMIMMLMVCKGRLENVEKRQRQIGPESANKWPKNPPKVLRLQTPMPPENVLVSKLSHLLSFPHAFSTFWFLSIFTDRGQNFPITWSFRCHLFSLSLLLYIRHTWGVYWVSEWSCIFKK